DTAVVDLSHKLSDPVDGLFGTQLGGGTGIHQALSYWPGLVPQPNDTIVVLVSDFIEGGGGANFLKRAASILASCAPPIPLLALSDDGAPCYDQETAADLATLGSPAFACTPDLFPELMATAIQRQDIAQWAASRDVAVARCGEPI